jgi:hypothetical protein
VVLLILRHVREVNRTELEVQEGKIINIFKKISKKSKT